MLGNRKATEIAAKLQIQSSSSSQVGGILHAADKRKDLNFKEFGTASGKEEKKMIMY